MCKPPTLVISALIAANSSTVSTKCDGDLPLHIALKRGASFDVIQMLILSYPDGLKQADSNSALPKAIFQQNIFEWPNDHTKKLMRRVLEKGVDAVELDDGGNNGSKEVSTTTTVRPTSSSADTTTDSDDLATSLSDEGWMKAGLAIVVMGASGDLAKKKTYPSLLHLYNDNLLPKDTIIWGFARSKITDAELRQRLRPFLEKPGNYSPDVIDKFLSICFYQKGRSYGDTIAFQQLSNSIKFHEDKFAMKLSHNRLFYFAIPPNVFATTGVAIKQYAMAEKGWTRMIIEKPFGRDLESAEEIIHVLSKNFEEENLYRIDHYLGKEMVQNLLVLRFGNLWFEKLWNRDNIECVLLTFKEPFGTEGRGGYYDQYGILRDIIQNHLLQVLTLLAMECPHKADGPEAGESIRDAKVNVLNTISPITIDDVFLGQYEGYTDDPTIENKDSNTPTFAVVRCFVNNPRWSGVPFIMKAGKALNERKAEMRIQFKDAPASEFLFDKNCPRNELVMRLQPDEAIYFKTNVKSPGFSSDPIQSELEVNYSTKFFEQSSNSTNPDAYTRLILDVLRGRSAAFVREDELRRSWEIFTPLLHLIEQENLKPVIYKRGTRGPEAADEFFKEKSGYKRNEDYVFNSTDGKVIKKADGLADVGVYGLAVMGQNFALNIASHGFKVCVGNRSAPKVDLTLRRAQSEGNLPLVKSTDPQDFIQKLKRPRKVIMLVQAGKPVDETIHKLSKYMEQGDILVDGGNELYSNSIKRAKDLESSGIMFVGMGISGGEEGARNGPSLMPGGSKEAFHELEPILNSCAAQVDDGPCTGYVGPIGSGNYVKTIHNGIEYAVMQIIAEAYDILKNIGGFSNQEISDIFADWNKNRLESYLIEITASIMSKVDDITGNGHVIDYIKDKTGMKGTGRWTVQAAAEVSVAAPAISTALDSRYISARKDERVKASKILKGPKIDRSKVDKEALINNLEKSLYASTICSYAQGLGVIKAASDEHNWNIDLSLCARLWKGGCIIRAALLGTIQAAFRNSYLPNLMMDSSISKELSECNDAWRHILMLCTENGIPCPSLASSLAYYDMYRTRNLPANLTQAQRDYFGGHSYLRVDREGAFHCAWTEHHYEDIGDINERTKGEN